MYLDLRGRCIRHNIALKFPEETEGCPISVVAEYGDSIVTFDLEIWTCPEGLTDCYDSWVYQVKEVSGQWLTPW